MRLLISTLIVLHFLSVSNAHTVQLTGTISRLKVGTKVGLTSFRSQKNVGTWIVKDSTFKFDIKADKPDMYFLGFEDSTGTYAFVVYMDANDMDLKLQNNFSLISFTGNNLAVEQQDFFEGQIANSGSLKKLEYEIEKNKRLVETGIPEAGTG